MQRVAKRDGDIKCVVIIHIDEEKVDVSKKKKKKCVCRVWHFRSHPTHRGMKETGVDEENGREMMCVCFDSWKS